METNQILNFLLILSIVLAVIFFIWYISGNSPTAQEVLVVFVLPLYVFVFSVYEKVNKKIDNLHKIIFETRENMQKELGAMKIILSKIEAKLKL